jgi:hypothetical protein
MGTNVALPNTDVGDAFITILFVKTSKSRDEVRGEFAQF